MTDNNSLTIARRILLEPAGLTENHLEQVLGKMLGHTVDNADLYFQTTHYEAWVLEDGIIKEGNYSIERGVGVRAMHGEKTGFAYSDDVVLPALEQAANAARSIARQGNQGQLKAWSKPHGEQRLYL